MRKILLTAAICAALVSCGKDDPTANLPTPGTTTGGIEPSTSESSKKTEGTKEEVMNYFGLNTDLNVYQVAKMVSETKGEKQVNGNVMEVTGVTEVSRDEQEGKLTIRVDGRKNGEPFSKELSLDGFAKKPSDYFMASRATARWKEKSNYRTEFDFDALYRLKNTGKFTAQYLSKWVEFYSTSVGGNDLYIFTEEDINKTQISDIKFEPNVYSAGEITFVITYNGIEGNKGHGINGRLSLSFNKNEYYSRKVTLTPGFAGKYYMRGVYEYADAYYWNALEFDENAFVAEMTGDKVKDDQDNSISVTISLTKSGSDEEIARFDKTITGFKPLSDLKNELILAQTSELSDEMSKRLKSAKDGDVLSIMQRYPISNWIKKTQMGVRRGNGVIMLSCQNISSSNGNSIIDVWTPNSRRVTYLDIYLESPHFELKSARKEGNWLKMQIALTYVNGTSVDGVIVPLEVLIM